MIRTYIVRGYGFLYKRIKMKNFHILQLLSMLILPLCVFAQPDHETQSPTKDPLEKSLPKGRVTQGHVSARKLRNNFQAVTLPKNLTPIPERKIPPVH
jgi:hypothetical protein